MSSLLKVVCLTHRGSRIAGKSMTFDASINLAGATVVEIVAGVQNLR